MTKILIIKLGALGDVLRTTCILPGLHQKYLDARIFWLTADNAACLLEGNPLIDTVIQMEELALATLKKDTYDLVINLDDEKAACSLAATLQTKQLFGAYDRDGQTHYTSDSSNWFNLSLISTFGKEQADKLKRLNRKSYPNLLFQALGIPAAAPSLYLDHAEIDFAHRFARTHLEPSAPIVGLNTGAGIRWQYKKLGVEQTIDLANKLSKSNTRQILLFGGPKERNRNSKIANQTNCPIIDTGTSNKIMQFAALVGLTDILVTSDSLALHVASALGIRTVAFFGPTSAAEIELFTPGRKIVAELPCVCCYKKECDFLPNCMDVISTDDIAQAVDELIDLKIARTY